MDIFTQICKEYNLGKLVSEPVTLTGGFLHKMYGIRTEKGKYAVKLLNPYVMKREDAKENYRIAEELEAVLENHAIPVLPAMVFDNRKMQETGGQFFYIFEWYDGKALHGSEIHKEHCVKIARTLAEIHSIDKKEEAYSGKELHIDWDFYLEKLKSENEAIYALLKNNRKRLYDMQEKGNAAIGKLPGLLTICHNDMDCKNVLWSGEEFRIIDLECLSYASPLLEMYELALCWSGYEECKIDFSLFRLFFKTYFEKSEFRFDDWEALYYSNFGRLEWLAYNLTRTLGIECDESEKEIGISETVSTLEHLVYYDRMKKEVIQSMSDM